MTLTAKWTCSSVMTSGGASRMMLTCVAARPRILPCQPLSAAGPVDRRRTLRQKALALHQQADLPGTAALLRFGLVDDDGDQQALAADRLDPAIVGRRAARSDRLEFLRVTWPKRQRMSSGVIRRLSHLEFSPHELAHSLCTFRHLLVDQDVQRGRSDRASERVAAVRRAVLAGLDDLHDVVVAQDGRDGVDAPGQGFSERRDVATDVAVVLAEPVTSGLSLARTWTRRRIRRTAFRSAQSRFGPRQGSRGHCASCKAHGLLADSLRPGRRHCPQDISE